MLQLKNYIATVVLKEVDGEKNVKRIYKITEHGNENDYGNKIYANVVANGCYPLLWDMRYIIGLNAETYKKVFKCYFGKNLKSIEIKEQKND